MGLASMETRANLIQYFAFIKLKKLDVPSQLLALYSGQYPRHSLGVSGVEETFAALCRIIL